VNIDKTAPVTTISSVPAWSNGSVSLSLGATDNLSGVASTSYSVDGQPAQGGTSIVIASEGVHTVQYSSTDVAGNVEAAKTTIVRMDKAGRTIRRVAARMANGAGWNNTNAMVTFVCSDSLSGIATCTSPQTVSAEGAGQTVNGQAVDNAGNSASASATLNID